jgi:hypothetical protein
MCSVTKTGIQGDINYISQSPGAKEKEEEMVRRRELDSHIFLLAQIPCNNKVL